MYATLGRTEKIANCPLSDCRTNSNVWIFGQISENDF